MTILVTGATGTVGGHITRQLVEAGQRVRALTRNPAAAKLPAGVEVVAGDLTAPQTLAAALDGITALHLITFGGDDAATLTTAPEILELAKRAGARRVTVLTGFELGPVEQAAKDSGLEWTLVRPAEFMSNALEWAESIRTENVVRQPFADQLSAKVHEADIAAVTVTALLEDGHAGKLYPLTGPEALTVPESVRLIGAALGREVEFVELTQEQARELWRAMGYPEEYVEFGIQLGTNRPAEGYTVVPTIEEVTGRPARTFAQWAQENADAFR